MRDYAKVAPQFWTGKTGKALKAAGAEAVIVGMYLMTSPHANMIGVYHCPLQYIAFDTGLGLEGASKGLQSCIEAGFCTYEADCDYVFVHEFAAYQIGEELDEKDNRCKGIKNELDKVPKGQCWQSFRARYAVGFHLPADKKTVSPFKAPPKPETGAGAEDPPKPPPPSADGFAKFWESWPSGSRKVAKDQCLKKWHSKGCEAITEQIVQSLEVFKASPDWIKDGGQFIPSPLTWLNQARWEAAGQQPIGEGFF